MVWWMFLQTDQFESSFNSFLTFLSECSLFTFGYLLLLWHDLGIAPPIVYSPATLLISTNPVVTRCTSQHVEWVYFYDSYSCT